VGAGRARADIDRDRAVDDAAMINSVLTELAWQFSLLSFLAIGGVNALIPEIHRRVVEMEHWMTDADFAQAFAIAQAAPGPNMLIVSVIGWKVSGLLGALVATAAICVPSSALTFAVAHIWDRFREAPLRAAIQHGLAPVTVGLVLASGYILARTVDQTWVAFAITVATMAVTLATRLHPLLLLAAGAALGIAGFV
jgi:chromate transporter